MIWQKSGRWRRVVTACILLGGLSGCASPFGALSPVTRQGLAITNLFSLVLALSFLLLFLVLGVLLVAMVRFRGRAGDPEPVQVSGSRRLEVAWTAGSTLLLGFVFVLVLQTMGTVEAPAPAPLAVSVVGHQWWWEFRYAGPGAVTANELHLPLGTPVQAQIESADVLHSFWVPQFGRMMDAIPGRTNRLQLLPEQTGQFDGSCTQFCGLEHAWMKVRAVVEPPAQFDVWLALQQQPASPPQSDLARRGQAVFVQSTCVSCHTIRGTSESAAVGPDLTHLAGRATLGAGAAVNSPVMLEQWIRDARVLKPGVLMPPYALPREDMLALVAYLGGLK